MQRNKSLVRWLRIVPTFVRWYIVFACSFRQRAFDASSCGSSIIPVQTLIPFMQTDSPLLGGCRADNVISLDGSEAVSGWKQLTRRERHADKYAKFPNGYRNRCCRLSIFSLKAQPPDTRKYQSKIVTWQKKNTSITSSKIPMRNLIIFRHLCILHNTLNIIFLLKSHYLEHFQNV